MLKLDNTLLDELGLGSLPEEQKKAMLQHIYETLELRVGTDLANQMTDQQLEEFEKFIDAGGEANQAQALQWLESNLPNYKDVVNRVFEELKGEVKAMAPQIMAASLPAGQPATAAPVAQPQVPVGGAPYQQPGMPAGSYGGDVSQKSYASPAAPAAAQPYQPAVVPGTYQQPSAVPQQPVQGYGMQQPAPAPVGRSAGGARAHRRAARADRPREDLRRRAAARHRRD